MTPSTGTSERERNVVSAIGGEEKRSTSRTLIYIFSTVAGVLSIEYLLFPFLGMVGLLSEFPPILSPLFREGPYLFLLARGVVWFKRRRIAPPASFSGIPHRIASISLVVLALAIGFYLLAFGLGVKGLSGIPLAFVVLPIGVAFAIITPIVELADWVAFYKEHRRAVQVTSGDVSPDSKR